MSTVVWQPEADLFRRTRIYNFMQRHQIEDYRQLYERSVEDLEWYWDAVMKDLDIQWYQPYRQVMDTSEGIAWTKWFVGGKTNLALNTVDKRKDSTKTALIWEGDDGHVRTLSYAELYREANKAANALEQEGVEKGDRVVIYMPMVPEIVVTVLACAKIGAIFTPVFSGYGAEAVAGRANDCEAKLLVTADGFYRRGRAVAMKQEADKAVAMCPSIEKVVVVRRLGAEIPWQKGRDIWFHEWLAGQSEEYQTREMDSEDPFMLIYTSGTTGKPKGTVHVHAGFPFKAAQDMAHSMDLGEEDIIFWYTDMGWMMGPWLVTGSLILGATMVLFEGTPDYPNPDRLWELVDKHRVTMLGISPTAIRSLMSHGDHWPEKHHLTTLRQFASSGEPWNPDPWLWLFEKVGRGKRPILNYSGGTEISGGIVGCVPALPMKPCGFSGPILGIAAEVVDSDCQPVRGAVGELIIKKPCPGMTRGFWRDPQRYLDTYWSRWPDVWVHGDWCRVDEDGFWFIEGRSDDTLNIAGKRVGPAEIESALVAHPAVVEAAVVGVPHRLKGEVAACFVKVASNYRESRELAEELKETVANALGKALKPQSVYFVPELPRTRSGKILRRVVKAAHLQQQMGDLSSLENPQAVEFIRNLSSDKVG